MTHEINGVPILLKPDFAAIPKSLKALEHWVLWKAMPDGKGGIKKVPFTVTGTLASSTDPATWSSFNEVAAAYAKAGYAGVGFVVTREIGVVGVDLDKLDTHTHQPEVAQIKAALLRSGTYVERSPSGAGLRAFLLGVLPFNGKNNRTLGIELYCEGRYLTVTGHQLQEAGDDLAASQTTIGEIVELAFPPAAPTTLQPSAQSAAAIGTCLPDIELLQRARASKNGASFTLLWKGRWADYYKQRGEVCESQSEADLALCLMLAFWTSKDAKRIDQLFRQSGLMRPKWDEQRGAKTYGEITVAKAIDLTTDVYSAPPTGTSELEMVALDKVTPQPLEWLWHGFYPLGKVSLLSGNPGLGKSQITLEIAARVSTGKAWPTGEAGKRGRVILVSAEDDAADTIVPRLNAVGADLSRIVQIKAVKETDTDGKPRLRTLSLERDLDRIGVALRETRDVRLIVIDPISAYLGKTDSHNNAETRSLLEPLSRMAQEHRVAVLLVSHLNKGSGEAIYRTSGSIAFVAASRAAFIVVKDDSNPAHRLMLPVKANLGPDALGLGYEVREAANKAPYVVWDQQAVSGSEIESLLQQSQPGDGDKLREAIDWLKDKLSTGPMHSAQIVSIAKKDGIAERTLERAKQKLGVKASATAGRWEWHLPPPQLQLPPRPPQAVPSPTSAPPWVAVPPLPKPPDYIKACPYRNL